MDNKYPPNTGFFGATLVAPAVPAPGESLGLCEGE